MARHKAPGLRSFTAFSQTMANLSYLKKINRTQRAKLLRDLYEAAEVTGQMERAGKIAREVARMLRARRGPYLEAIKWLGKMLDTINTAIESHGDILAECEEVAGDWDLQPFTFRGIQTDLHFSVEFLKSIVNRDASAIAPRLRRPPEKRLATEYMAAFDDVAEGADEPNYLGTEKQKGLDTWLVHTAAECIDRYIPVKERPLRDYGLIIERLFEAAFVHSEGYDRENIRKMLTRSRKPQGLEYVPGQGYCISKARVFFPDTKFLGDSVKRRSARDRKARPGYLNVCLPLAMLDSDKT